MSPGGCGHWSFDGCAPWSFGGCGHWSFGGCGHWSFGGCGHWSFGGCGPWSIGSLRSVSPIENLKGSVLSVNGQDPQSGVRPCSSIWAGPVMMNEIEYGKDGVYVWIWLETTSGVNVELHRQARQILDLISIGGGKRKEGGREEREGKNRIGGKKIGREKEEEEKLKRCWVKRTFHLMEIM